MRFAAAGTCARVSVKVEGGDNSGSTHDELEEDNVSLAMLDEKGRASQNRHIH